MMLNEQVGERLRSFRDAAKMTQRGLAEQLGISESRISGYERGRVRISYEMGLKWERICKAAAEQPTEK